MATTSTAHKRHATVGRVVLRAAGWGQFLRRDLWDNPVETHCVSKNAPTSESCSFDKHKLILIIYGKQHQHTFTNDMRVQLSLSLHFYLLYYFVFIARQHTDARYWYSNSVCLSVRPWRSGIRWKWLNILSLFFFPEYSSPINLVLFISIKHLHEIQTGSTLRWR